MTRDPNARVLIGLCATMAKNLNADPTLVRLGVIFVTIASGLVPGVVTYLIGWAITPTVDGPAPCRRLWSRLRPKPGKELDRDVESATP